MILWAVRRLEDPLRDPLATLEVGGLAIPLTLELLVIASWALIVGFAMQHYYLDSKIWRVRKDKQVRKYLKVD